MLVDQKGVTESIRGNETSMLIFTKCLCPDAGVSLRMIEKANVLSLSTHPLDLPKLREDATKTIMEQLEELLGEDRMAELTAPGAYVNPVVDDKFLEEALEEDLLSAHINSAVSAELAFVIATYPKQSPDKSDGKPVLTQTTNTCIGLTLTKIKKAEIPESETYFFAEIANVTSDIFVTGIG